MTTAPLEVPLGFRGAFYREEPERARYAGASGVVRILPAAVAVPADAADLSVLLAWAAETRTSVVPRGAGTGMPGGNVGGGVVVDLLRGFRRIDEVNAAARTIRVGPGVTRVELNAACAPHGLHLPVDPSSGERCGLGGMIANNAAGARSVRHGATRAWVEALEVVLADGTRAVAARGERPSHPRLRQITDDLRAAFLPERACIEGSWPRVRKNSSGYALRDFLKSGDIVDLLVGSEGTLALVTGAVMRLAQIPAARALAVLEFTSLEEAGAAVERIAPHQPSACEILDRTFLELVRRGGGDDAYPLRPGLEAILFVETEGASPAEAERALQAIIREMEGIAARVVTATDPSDQERLWRLRHAASPLIARMAGDRVSMQFIEDGVVPIARLPEYITLLRETLARRGLPAVIFGHAGDGNLHVNPLVDVSAPGWREDVEEVAHEVAEGVARLGGTMAGEHGDGRLRAPLLETIWGAEMVGRFRRIKARFDPEGILNPGVILPLPGQRVVDGVGAGDR
ncbi:MAG: FAD-binding oxidoreductase [Gemmatimonadota bacterium]|nr:FAD-binding oxidoreductase [Gemmatimonadota bacterium]